MTINADGYGLNEAMVSAIEAIVNAVAPGAAGVSSVGGSSGAVSLRTINAINLTDGGSNIALQVVLVSGTNIKTVNGTSLLGSGDVTIAGGSGADEYADLTDKATVNLPSVNTPLASALSGKQATLVSATNIKTINGVSVLGSGDMAVAGASAWDDLTDKATADLPTDNTALAAALDLKVPILAPVNLGSGAIALNAEDHANRCNIYLGASDVTATIDPSAGEIGDIYSISNYGSGVITMPGTAGSGYKLTIEPNCIGEVEWGGTIFLSGIVDAVGVTAGAPAVVSGSGGIGAVLTCTPGTGYFGTFQWQMWDGDSWEDIVGETAATYTIEAEDTQYRCTFAGIYHTNLVVSEGGGGETFFRFLTLSNAHAVESGTGPYTYTWAVDDTSCALSGGNLKMPAGVACEIVFLKTALTGGSADNEFTRFKFDTQDDGAAPVSGINIGVNNSFFYDANGADTAVVIANGSKVKLHKDTSHNLKVSTWPNGGSAWTEQLSVAGSNVDYFIDMSMDSVTGTGQAYEIESQTGMVAV